MRELKTEELSVVSGGLRSFDHCVREGDSDTFRCHDHGGGGGGTGGRGPAPSGGSGGRTGGGGGSRPTPPPPPSGFEEMNEALEEQEQQQEQEQERERLCDELAVEIQALNEQIDFIGSMTTLTERSDRASGVGAANAGMIAPLVFQLAQLEQESRTNGC